MNIMSGVSIFSPNKVSREKLRAAERVLRGWPLTDCDRTEPHVSGREYRHYLCTLLV